jgi:hypothetical protein
MSIMSISPKLTFGGITRAIFSRLCKKASKRGIQVVGPVGEAIRDGVRIQWNYDATSEHLEVECTHAPFWIDSARINKELRLEIEATLDASRAARVLFPLNHWFQQCEGGLARFKFPSITLPLAL